jgi:hypothetical protein
MKKILILIHPDAVIDRGEDIAKEYLSLLEEHIPKFDAVFVNQFYSDNYHTFGYMKDEIKDVYFEIINYLKNSPNLNNYERDYGDGGKAIFEGVVLDYIADNSDNRLEIYMSGGNQDLCLLTAHKTFCKTLFGLVKEEDNLSYQIYSPLVYRYAKFDKNKELAPAGMGLFPGKDKWGYDIKNPLENEDLAWYNDPNTTKKSRASQLLFLLKKATAK